MLRSPYTSLCMMSLVFLLMTVNSERFFKLKLNLEKLRLIVQKSNKMTNLQKITIVEKSKKKFSLS